MKTCKTCELIANRDAGTAPLWDCIYRTLLWDVAHCYDTALPGWLVLVARRHIESLDELTDPEAVELGRLIRRTSAALKEITGCLKTYVIQFAESLDPQTRHGAGLEYELVRASEREVVIHIHACQWARYFQERHPRVGYLMACCVDEAEYRAANPRIRMQRTQTLMEGGEQCDFRIYTVD